MTNSPLLKNFVTVASFPFISLRLENNQFKNSITPKNGQLLGKQKSGSFILNAYPNENNTSVVTTKMFSTDSGKRIHVLNPDDSGCTTFEFPIHENNIGGYTKTGFNNACIVTFQNPGNICVYECGIVSQWGNHFFMIQRKYHTFLFKNNDGTVFLKGLKWDNLLEFLATTNIEPVQKPFDFVEETEQELPQNFGRKEGQIAWFDPLKSSGAIATKKGMAKIHYSDIITGKQQKLIYPPKGQKVVFERLVTPPPNIKTTFPYIAKGVRIQ